MALLTSATSGSEVCGVGACAGSTAGGLAKPLAPCGPDAALARAEAPEEPGRARGRGTAARAGLSDADSVSLDLADAALSAPGFAALAATFAIAADGLLLPP